QERVLQGVEEHGALRRRRLGFLLGGHLAGLDAVVDLHPAGEVVDVGEVALERGQVEPALFRLRVVALDAVLLEIGLVLEAKQDRGEGGAHASSSPAMVPFEVENSAASIPSRCSMLRYRLVSG